LSASFRFLAGSHRWRPTDYVTVALAPHCGANVYSSVACTVGGSNVGADRLPERLLNYQTT